jgi:hypothetical protein
MKMEDKVAGKFLKAKGIRADYGDVEATHNVFNFFEATDRKLSHDEVLMLIGMMQEAIYRTHKKRADLIRKALKANSADRKTLAAYGIELK